MNSDLQNSRETAPRGQKEVANAQKGGHSLRFGRVLPKRSTLASRSRFLGNREVSNTNSGNRGMGPDPGKSAVWDRFVVGFGNSGYHCRNREMCLGGPRIDTGIGPSGPERNGVWVRKRMYLTPIEKGPERKKSGNRNISRSQPASRNFPSN